MEYWEFLLQKEGDQSWLPLDASQVEIMEGRYRVMAHTSQTNTPVQIQISQLLHGDQEQRSGLQEAASKRRTLRRQGETNSNGLMVVMPFTRLREGTWDVQCASASQPEETMSAAAQPAWCYAVQLRVVGQDSADDGDWFADDGSEGLGAIAAAGLPSDPFAPEASAPDIDLEAAAAAMDAFQTQLAAGLANQALPYGLTLPHTALLGSEGESLGLTATVIGPTPSGDVRSRLTLVVRLSDPQTAVTVALAPAPLAVAALPTTVTLTVAVPPQLSTRLLLGEVGLLVGAEVVALQRFTVTVDVASLFDAIANQAETNTDLNIVFPAETADAPEAAATSPSPSPDLKTWDIASRAAPPREMPILTLPRGGPTLPPKIYYPSPHEAATHQPTLPPVGRPKPSSTAVPDPAPKARPAAEPGAPTRDTTAGSNLNRGLSLPPISPPPQTADPQATLSGQPTASNRKPRGPAPQLISHEAMGFKDLKLQDRFWARLNDLAVNLQQEALDRSHQETAEAAAAAVEEAAEAPPEFIPFAGEVVIYADEDPALSAAAMAQSTAFEDPDLEAAPEAITPPMPTLVLPEGELTAGEPVLVTLRVPFHPNRLYLKVWITDPQTRSLADEPRQVMNLLPNGQGQMEGNLQLTVPLGCLEARFEAISIDMVTQQESYKTSISRAITLPGLTSPGLDEFQL
ncbi:hypothetical protein IQ265_18275 [Nodosilinea sp. LEGE 06152]|uniref:hypothetical protein n=1 Tax=Nodosilinea sp. LEGE 06152 TaxID=2777966 RepID=UPI001882EA1D|nr:hypothetical protein [Nodosilinea sp. LEGE 06152]MBE9158764.1 hypothetical protein [Nodosilinea sp. LEGE 06152]